MTYDKEVQKQYMKEWREKNREHRLAYGLKYRAENREEMNKKKREKYWGNPEEARAYRMRKHFQNRQRDIARSWTSTRRDKIIPTLGGQCKVCEKKENLVIHHKKYTNNLEDMACLCTDCHGLVHSYKRQEVEASVGERLLY